MFKKLFATVLQLIDNHHAELITGIAAFGMLGSLYFSNYGDPVANVAAGVLFPLHGGLIPCMLCWYARIFMYPLVFIGGIAAVLQDKIYAYYALALSALGALVTGFHSYLQATATPFAPCKSIIPCSEIQLAYFGFVTIPLLGFIAFLILVFIAGRVVYTLRKK